MGSFTLENNRFLYTDLDQEKTQILLDLNDYLSNKSRVSLHRLSGQEYPIVSDIMLRLLEKAESEDADTALPVIMIDTLIAARLIRSSQPFRVLEYGCGDGRLSGHLAELLGFFHAESTLVCAYNTLDFTSMAWMERMADIERLPRLSYFAGDYGHLQLQKHSFHIVVINGFENYADPCEVLSDALELVSEDGILLCHVNDSPLLESTFQLFFQEREEYAFSPFQKVFLAKAEDGTWKEKVAFDFLAQARGHLELAQDILLEKRKNQTEILALADVLHQDSKTAAAEGNIGLKIELLEKKEQLISLLV